MFKSTLELSYEPVRFANRIVSSGKKENKLTIKL